MKTAITLALTGAFFATSAFAQEEVVTPAPERDANGIYQVFRITDSKLNCEQLIGEMNYLNASIKAQTAAPVQQAEAPAAAGQGAAVAQGLAGAVAAQGLARGLGRFGGGLGGFGGIGNQLAAAASAGAASQQQAAAQQQALAAQQAAMAPAAPQAPSDHQQRLSRVTQLFQQKAC